MNDEKLDRGATGGENKVVFDAEPEAAPGQETASVIETPPETITKETPAKKGGAARLLLLLLLVVAGFGAGFYLFGQDLLTPEAPAVQAEPQKTRKMKVPDRLPIAESSEAVKEEVVSTEKIVAVESKPSPTAVSTPVQAPAPKPAFALTAGSFLYKGELKRVTSQVEKMGFKTKSRQESESHEMTRLLVGRFEKSLAEKRLAEVKKLSDGAFLAAENGEYAVYAGSFLSLDKARRMADILYQKGVRVDERQIKVELPQTTLRFGEFATRADAQGIMNKLKKLGVENVQIVPFK